MYTLLTGACGGLGGAFARLLAQRGRALFLTGRSEERLKALAKQLSEKYPALPVLTKGADFTSFSAAAVLATVIVFRSIMARTPL